MARRNADHFDPHDGEFGPREAAHLLNRAGFGGTPGEIEAVVGLGLDRAVDRLLDFPDAPTIETSPDDRPDLSPMAGLPTTYDDRRATLRRAGDDAARDRIRGGLRRGGRQVAANATAWWLGRMAAGPHPLHEKLVLFWHGHFTTSVQSLNLDQWLVWPQHETLRAHAAGDFRAFCKAVSRDPAMILYLNNQQNKARSPNENYARELMELFTLGVGNYTERDIKEAARAFTGWHTDGESFVLRLLQHDDGPKTVFSRTADFDGDGIVDLLMEHPACAPHVARQMLRFFVNDTPDDAAVAQFADGLRGDNYALRPALSALFRSRHFYDEANVSTLIKSPIQLLVGTARLTGAGLPPGRAAIGMLRRMGQVPFMPPTVEGWPGGRGWVNTATLLARTNAAIAVLNFGGPVLADEAGDAGAFVDLWLGRLVSRPVAPARRQAVVDAAGTRLTEAAARTMLELIVSLPEYQLC